MRRALAATALLVLGCGGLAPGLLGGPSDAERAAYRDAVARLKTDRAGGEQALERFLTTWPGSRLAPDAELDLGDSRAAAGDPAGALRWYGAVVERHPGSAQADAARFGMAKIELARGDRVAAARALSGARLARLPADERREAYRLLADAAEDPVAKLRWLSSLRAAEGDDEDAVALVDVEIDQILLELDADSLRQAANRIGDEIPAARALIQAAALSIDAGELDLAKDAIARAQRLPLSPRYQGRLQLVEDRLLRRLEGPAPGEALPSFAELATSTGPATAGAAGTLGVVLPLSGRFASVGEESLRGVLLAAGVFEPLDRTGLAPRVRVLIRDTAGRPERAADAVRELSDLGVSAIVGPLFSRECEAAAEAAEAAGVPLLALTAREEVAADRPQVFRLRTEPGEETRALVEQAMGAMGARRFAILYPRDAYGRGLRQLFWDEVERRGGEIVAIASFDPEATDFGDPIRQLVGYTLLSDQEKGLLRERERLLKRAQRLPLAEATALREEAAQITAPGGGPLPPIVDFDALFLPASYENVVLIAPQLAYHEVFGARLLGTNGWSHPDLVSIGEEYVEGALFTTHFYAGSELPFVKRFTGSYTSTYQESPDVLAAQAYDAANLVLVQLARGGRTREDVREGVLHTRNYPGVSGILSMRSDGNASKRPFLLSVEKGKLVAID